MRYFPNWVSGAKVVIHTLFVPRCIDSGKGTQRFANPKFVPVLAVSAWLSGKFVIRSQLCRQRCHKLIDFANGLADLFDFRQAVILLLIESALQFDKTILSR